MPGHATDKLADKAQPDLKARLASVRDRCTALRGHKPAAKNAIAAWPSDLNTSDHDAAWGSDPAEVRDE